LFAGAALYVSLVEHPARMACGPMLAVAQFRRSYPRGAALQAPLAVIGALGGLGAWPARRSPSWLAAALPPPPPVPFPLPRLLPALAVVFTLVAMLPLNHRLQDPSLEPDTPEAARLLRQWGHLHLVRTALGLVALALVLRLGAGR